MDRETTQRLISEGILEREGYDYREVKTGMLISRVYVGRRGRTEKWKRADDTYLYRSVLEAYYRAQF